jgi:ABC-2 type transport system permease protein
MLGAAIKKDVWLLLRDRGALISLFALPIIFIVAFGSMFRFGGENASERDVPVSYAEGDARAERIVKALEEAPGFAPERLASADEVRARVAHEDATAGLVIPSSGPIELVIDLGSPIQARAPIQGALTSLVSRAVYPTQSSMPPVVDPKTPPGISKPLAGISSFQVTVPGNAVLFGFFMALTTAMAFLGERKNGTWRRLLAAPVRRSTAMLATLVPDYLVASTEKMLGGVGSVVLLIMGMLGGCMVPRLVMPPFMKTLGLAVPHGWALDGYYAVLVREGTGIADIFPSIAALLVFGSIFAALGLALFKFER